jgi:hypothetical protein
VGDDQLAVVEHVVADQAPAEVLDLRAEHLVLAGELFERRLEAVADPDVAAAERLDELVLVVARDAQGVAGADHAHDQAQHPGAVRPAVDEITHEHRPATVGVGGVDRAALLVRASS